MRQLAELPAQWHALVAQRPDTVLLQTARFDAINKQSLLFVDPVRTMAARQLDEIPGMFAQLDEAVVNGFHVAGYLGYECGYHFERRFDGVSVMPEALPLAWFGVYREPLLFDHVTGLLNRPFTELTAMHGQDQPPACFADHVELSLSEEDYREKIQQIKQYIAAGETYQVNFTDRVSVASDIPADAAFRMLLRHQPVAYSAFLNVAGHYVLSLSPELFFKAEGGRIVTRPMKGTMPRGLDLAEDAEAALRLRNDEKNRCEHVMIVDLLRNDLGRICAMGSVQVEDIFSVEKYETLLQMTSTIAGTLREGLSYYDLFKAMFPSGSITGAPKIRTMQIIRELEQGPRGIYTGAIGHIAPSGDATFNVAIRTLVLKDGEARMGVGGGIVADSGPSDEYRECLLKTEFLTRRRHDFQLIETMLWVGKFSLLALHLDRLESSAEYFNIPCDRGAIAARLSDEARYFQTGRPYRVRMLLDEAGKLSVTVIEHSTGEPAGAVCLSAARTSSSDVFLRHKTTNRKLYEEQYATARAAGFDDVIFMNEREEITEGAISNILIQYGEELFTPPLTSGVLAGVYRRHLLETNTNVSERVLRTEDLASADAVFLCNSVRGLWKLKSIFLDDSTRLFYT